MLAQVPGVDIPAADDMSRLQRRHEDRLHLELKDSIPVFQVEIGIALKKRKQKEDQSDYFPHDEADENIRKHRPNNSDDKESGQKEHEHPTMTENKRCPPDDSARQHRTSENIAERPDDPRQINKHMFIATPSNEQRKSNNYG